MERPQFKDIISFEEFCKYYWYREELQGICKDLGLEYVGNKSQLNNIIKSYFGGEKILHTPQGKARVIAQKELSLDTGLIECGFTFGPKFREFYILQTGDKNFKFNADMVATARAVRENEDVDFTLGDLLDVKLGKRAYAKFDNASCQWNKFLKDFCADEINGEYKDKLKTASKFWKLLRVSDLPKKYTREFIEQNKDKFRL